LFEIKERIGKGEREGKKYTRDIKINKLFG